MLFGFVQASAGGECLAEILVGEATKYGLSIQLSPTPGSEVSLAKVAAGELDAAFVLGDLGFPETEISEMAVLYSEPMHLFVKPELAAQGLAGLRGKTLSRSGARRRAACAFGEIIRPT